MGITSKASILVKQSYSVGDEFSLKDFLKLLNENKLSSAMGTAKRTTQELRDLGILHFLGKGRYELIEGSVSHKKESTILSPSGNKVDVFKDKVNELNTLMQELSTEDIEVAFHHKNGKFWADVKKVQYL